MTSYNEIVNVFSAAGANLGNARFIWAAQKEGLGGLWSWSGILDIDFDPGGFIAQELRLEFDDGTSGSVICTTANEHSRVGRATFWHAEVRGKGAPPRLATN